MSDQPNIGDIFDVGGGEASASPDRLAVLHRLANEAIALELTIEQLQGDLDAAKERLNTLKAGRMPDLMDELKMPSFQHEGWEFSSHRFVSGTLSKEEPRRTNQLKYIEQNGGDGLLKTNVIVAFEKSGHNRALALADDLRKEFGDQVSVESGIHHQTFLAWARERLDDKKPVDTDLLGLFVGRVTKAEVAKEKKPKAGRKPK